MEPLPFVKINDPTVEMTFSVNDSPLAGRAGKFVTSRQIRDRLQKELLKDCLLYTSGCVVQRSEQILFHVSDWAAVLCKALQHKTDMVGVQLHKPAAYHLGGLVVPGNVQQLSLIHI